MFTSSAARRVYLDNAATTAVHPEVAATIAAHIANTFGNPSSVHAFGREARKIIDESRETVAKALNANPKEIYFTASGTESDNWAIKGAVGETSKKKNGRHIITSAIEHHAVLHTFEWLAKNGYDVTYLPVDEFGLVSVDTFRGAIRDDTIFASVMTANNEIGTIQPIAELAKIARDRGVVFHTDAVQAVGSIEVDVQKLGVDLLSLSAHKFGGPKGIGVLYIRKGVRIEPFVHGGAQERNMRAGTENLPYIAGLAKAIELATANLDTHTAKLTNLRDKLISGLLDTIPETRLNGHATKRLPGNVNVSIRYVEGESLLLALDLKGIAASSGSACTSGSLDPSHVLLAIGLPHEIAHGSLRMSIGEINTEEDIDYVLQELPIIVGKLREMSPLYADSITA